MKPVSTLLVTRLVVFLALGVISASSGSAAYEVRINGATVPVTLLQTSFNLAELPDWFTRGSHTGTQQAVAVAERFADGPARVEIISNRSLAGTVIRPLSRGLTPVVEGGRLAFDLPRPDRLYLEIPGEPPLCLFVSPSPAPAPAPAPSVKYYGPGVHREGTIELRDHETLYLAPGAVLHALVRAHGARNIRIAGGGVLDGDNRGGRLVVLEDCTDVRLEDVTFRNSGSWTVTLERCTGVRASRVKVISFTPSGDGINPLNCSDVVISDCFFRCTDDCIAIKAPDRRVASRGILIERNTMVGYAFSDGVTIGFETNAPSISEVTVRNCDVVLSRGGSRVDGHSGFSIICDGPAEIHDILFEDIRVEQVEFKLFELCVTDGQRYGEGPPGRIRDVVIRGVHWLPATAPIVLRGHADGNGVSGVRFENCRVAGRPLSAVRGDVLRVGPFVSGVEVRD